MVNCGAPPAVANGVIQGSDYTYNAKITYSCIAANFKLDGPQERVCQADGTWTETSPACLGKSYFNPPRYFNRFRTERWSREETCNCPALFCAFAKNVQAHFVFVYSLYLLIFVWFLHDLFV